MSTRRSSGDHPEAAAGPWPALPASLRALATVPNDGGYEQKRSVYMAKGSPALVLTPPSIDAAGEAIAYAGAVRAQAPGRVPFSLRSGGHGIAGTGTNAGGIVLDLSELHELAWVDREAGIFRAQAGAVWGEVAAFLAPEGRALTSGNVASTGVGGLSTAGGVGYFARSQGLTLDRVLRIQVMTADARVRWVDAEHEPELFWGLRGGGSQLGAALAFEFQAPRLSAPGTGALIAHQSVQYVVKDLGAFTAAWGAWIQDAPREAESFLMLQPLGDAQTVVRATNVFAGDDLSLATPVLSDALELARVLQQEASLVPYSHIVPGGRGPHFGQQQIKMRDVLVDRADEATGEALARSLAHDATLLGELRSLGGAVSDVAPRDTAWAGRHQEALVGTWLRPLSVGEQDESFRPLQQIGTGSYGAYSSDLRPEAAELCWPGETGARLRALALEADPDGLFDGGLVLPRA